MILVINSGSSNAKFAIYDINNLNLLHRDKVETIQQIFNWLAENKQHYTITAIGHRIVHGGTKFLVPVVLDDSIIAQLKTIIPLAPLHLPHNIAAIEICRRKYPDVKQIGCFDTAFHSTQHKLAKLFAIPQALTAEGIIKYGFHGLSYEYIASILESKIGPIANNKIIVAHLGNGASICAMQHLHSVATSMGFSVLDGLMMGTRCGTIDPGVLLYLLQAKHYTAEQVSALLYSQSGLLGVSNISSDMQKLLASNNMAAQLAIDLFCYKAACELGSLIVSLRGCDAIVFTGGIGENAAAVRAGICAWLEWLDIKINHNENHRSSTIISAHNSTLPVMVIPTNEEYIIAKHTKTLV